MSLLWKTTQNIYIWSLIQFVYSINHNFSFLHEAKDWTDVEAGLAQQTQTGQDTLTIPSPSLLANLPEDDDWTNKANLVRFFLYTDLNSRYSPEELIHDYPESLNSSKFDKKIPTKFFIHGFGHSYNCSFPQLIKDTYINQGERLTTKRFNIIAVDWGKLSMDSTKVEPLAALINYKLAVDHVPIVGQRVGEFINFLYEDGATNLSTVHIVGFSLGSHVAGHAGHYIYQTMVEKIGRITGLDPAGPLFLTGLVGRHLSQIDAHFVDFIHTDIGQCGTPMSLGHVNFFVNGGTFPQPGCVQNVFKSDFLTMIPLILSGSCSHNSAPIFYIQSIQQDDLRAQKCFSYLAYESGICSMRSSVSFGDNCQTEVTGDYYLNLEPEKDNFLTKYKCR